MSTPLLVIGGPTGSGKSALAVQLAQTFDGEVINCDSLQVYRRFDIGTAKLREHERGGIRHHLIDVMEAHEGFTAGDFALAATRILGEITHRGRLPIVAGGTGFYLRALLHGLSPAPPSSGALRNRLNERQRLRPGSLHRILARLDPVSASRIHPRDVPKTVRALEIRILAKYNASEQPDRKPLEGYRVRKLGLFPDRDLLYQRLDERCQAMFQEGLLGEIERLLAGGISRDSKPFQSLGYKEGLAILENRMSFPEALERMQRDTRRYAKRQMTWFRHEPGIVALHGFGNDAAVQAEARELAQALIDSQ